MALKLYTAKRDLAKSREPKAKLAGSKTKEPVFVVQKHIASHLHYDLRLEADGVLKSWAIPKGFSGGGHQPNLAIMVEDHPFDYRNFKGIIPPGNYGAGKVDIWDKGTYSTYEAKGKKEIEQRILKGIREGHITFFLNGKKLSGEFALIKIKPRGRENSWLLIKSKGKFKEGYSPRMQAEDKKEYVETKLDSKEIIKTAFPEKIIPMMAKLTDKSFDKKGWIFELKLDGYRTIAKIRPDKSIELRSRNNILFNDKFPTIAKSLSAISLPAVLDGEIVAVKKNALPDFHALQQFVKTSQGNLIYFVFDILYVEDSDVRDVPLYRRKKILKYLLSNYLPDAVNIKYLDHTEENGEAMYQAAVKNRVEGIIAKDKKSKYESGQRTGAWLKIKKARTQEAIIIGLTAPRGHREYFGSLILAAYDGRDLKYIGHSGGGFSGEELAGLKKKFDKIITGEPPMKNIPKLKNVRWLKPKIVAEIKFTEWTPDGLMRQPVFMGIREDKNPRDVIIEK